MMKLFAKGSAKAQKGFTLVELSIVILVAGLMLTAVMKGQSMLESARAARLLNDVKNVEALIGQYTNMKGRLPGDCNRDGVINYDLKTPDYQQIVNSATVGNQGRAVLYDYSGEVMTAASDLATTASDLAPCKEIAGLDASEGNPNRWLNDLREANVVGRNTTNRLLAKHIAEDFIFVGKYTTTGGEELNAITVAGVPVAMAKRILLNVNGSEVNSSSGQMRVLTDAATTAVGIMTDANFAKKKQNDIVNLIFFYRNQPVAEAS